MKYFIVRTLDGRWLPQLRPYEKATASEPTNKRPPRLFQRKSDATNAMNWYKQGITYTKANLGGIFDEGDYIEFKKKQVLGRNDLGLFVAAVEITTIPFAE